jgi:hypothetical protein
MKIILYFLVFSILICYSCVTIPKEVKPSENDCQLTTKEYTLALHGNSKPYLEAIAEQSFFLLECGSGDNAITAFCNFINITIVGVSAGTFIVSGSIVIVGNTIHWIEKQGVCDDSAIKNAKVRLFKYGTSAGGWVVQSSNDIKDWIKAFLDNSTPEMNPSNSVSKQ